jgi:hypothetical protein
MGSRVLYGVRKMRRRHVFLPLEPRADDTNGGPSPSMYPAAMCRSIKTLRRPETAATTGELEAAARQFVRKISGYRTPSVRNADAFEAAIADVAASSRRLLESFGVAVVEAPDRWTPGSGSSRRATERVRGASATG